MIRGTDARRGVPAHGPGGEDQGHDDAGWLLLLATLWLVALLQFSVPFMIVPAGMAGLCVFLAPVVLANLVYRVLGRDEKIVAMTGNLQQMALFSAVGAILSYMVAARGGMMLWDARFAAADQALGLDWRIWMDWLEGHSWAAAPLGIAYRSLMPQMAALVLILGLGGRLAAMRTSVLAAMIAGLVTVLLSGMMPAVGYYAALGLDAADFPTVRPAAALLHMADLTALREGTLRVLTLDRMEGIITFPSYHAALATCFGWGFAQARRRALAWPGMALALLTIVATPGDGGHYFTDVIAGCLIAAASLAIARRAIGFRFRSSPSRRSHAMSGQ